MKAKILAALGVAILNSTVSLAAVSATDRQSYSVYVDKQGVMRRSDTGAEVSYYGTNYTVPFAHAYRALGVLGIDRKETIRRDVYHLARLGLNAFRLHLWEAELTDAQGNLLENEHLDLLDFLIAELEKRGIDIVLTAQTNFGNGYPEKNIDTGSFTYDFDKCDIHANPKAQKAQENYLRCLVRHVNPYTKRSYAADRAIIAIEINNEPCHTAPAKQVTAYINRMVKALRKGGFDKPVLYNVSHNPDVTRAYYDADIQGTTFQWYPTGLVAGRQRYGNFLPSVDEYIIPWSETMSGYKDKARFVYEFDPGDVLVSNLYPAIVRSFRNKGFQWVTQFAYDPTDMARFNTEYQTHFMNLAYTPAKALSMLIAAEAMQEVPRGADYGSYPANKSFGHTLLSDGPDASSLFNAPDRFIHTASTDVQPMAPDSLQHLAGVGSDPLVKYPGTGAWFLDRLDKYHWRLEVMPDVVLTEDPFAKPSLTREVGKIIYAGHPIGISLRSLGSDFRLTPMNEGNTRTGRASEGTVTVTPGVYLLSAGEPETDKWTADTPFCGVRSDVDNMRLGEFVAPVPSSVPLTLLSRAPIVQLRDAPLQVKARALAAEGVDSVVLYPGDVSFWREDNTLWPMSRDEADPYGWKLTLQPPAYTGKYTYRLTAFSKGEARTFPGGIKGTPLDWDFPENTPCFETELIDSTSSVPLVSSLLPEVFVEGGSVPDGQGAWVRSVAETVDLPAYYKLEFTPAQDSVRAVMKADVSRITGDIPVHGPESVLEFILPYKPEGMDLMEFGVTDSKGASYTVALNPSYLRTRADGMWSIEIPLGALVPATTYLLPAAYPSFMSRTYKAPSEEFDFATFPIYDITVRLIGLKKDCPVSFPLRAVLIKPFGRQ